MAGAGVVPHLQGFFENSRQCNAFGRSVPGLALRREAAFIREQ